MAKSRMWAGSCLPVLLACAVACSGAQAPPAESTSATPTAPPVDSAIAATIAGRVVIEGEVPAPEVVRMSGDPVCMRQRGGTIETEYFVVSGDRGLENVFVYVKNGLAGRRFAPPAAPVVLDQVGCRYTPHVVGVQVGQPLEVRNSDDTLHNVHVVAAINEEHNVGQPIKGMRHTFTFRQREVAIPLRCDVHGWMEAYVGVVEHPYFAVTAGGGAFALEGLPPGHYEVEAWHEKLGTRSQQVTVAERERKTIVFTFATR